MDKSSAHLNANQVQSGIIDVFKNFSVHQNNSKSYKKKGEVIHKMENEIGKKVISIIGSLSAGNFIEIPNPELQKSINYTGKYYFIHMSAVEDKKFCLQLTFTINSIPVKFNLKYPLSEMKFSQTNAFNIDLPLDFNTKLSDPPFNDSTGPFPNWYILKVNPSKFINTFLVEEFRTFGSISPENLILKSFTAYSTLKIRGLYISNNSYSSSNLPKELSFSKLDKNGKPLASMVFDLNHIFEVSNNTYKQSIEDDNKDRQNTSHLSSQYNFSETKKLAQAKFEERQNKLKNTLLKSHEEEFDALEKKGANLRTESKITPTKKSMLADKIRDLNNSTVNRSQSRGNSTNRQDMDLKEQNNDMLRKQMENANAEALDKRNAVRNIFKKQEEKKVALLPDPIMSLKFILGYSSKSCFRIRYSLPAEKNTLIFPNGSMLINYNQETLKQKFFLGHSKPITTFVLTHDLNFLFSAQEGKNAIIRVWKVETTRCINIFTTPYEKINSMTISRRNDILATVGLESYNKELIILWNISSLDKISVLIRQASHFNITQLKFSPYDQDYLVSCGKENIKFWRIKNDHLGGKAVVLNQFARNSNFQTLDFDNPFMGESASKGRLFVGNNLGCIFQISCNSKELDAVYKIHDSPITALAINDAFCVTGSEDGFVRVWPIDFSEFLIEAKHDSAVMSIDIAFDALEIICGTENGSIGSLNIQTKQYKTILRSPPGKVYSMSAHPTGNYLYTIEEGCAVRVWDIEGKCESFHFSSPKDPPSSVASPKQALILACGFASGSLKIFDIENTSVLYECRPFNQQISGLSFIQNSSILLAMSVAGHISLHDATGDFVQIKIIKIDSPAVYSDLAVTVEGEVFATIGSESTNVIVWNTTTYGIRNRIPLKNDLATKLTFFTPKLIGVVLQNGNINVFSLVSFEGVLVKEFNNLHSGLINCLSISKNLKFIVTGGVEGIIKILCAKMLYKQYSSYQQFIGHSVAIKSLIIIEHKSIIVSVSENDGIFFWNFLGDLTFSDSELIGELENLAVYNPSTTKKYKTLTTNKSADFRKTHLGNTYGMAETVGLIDHNSETTQSNNPIRKQIKTNIATRSIREADKLLMLPVDHDENEDNNLNCTKGSFIPDLNSSIPQFGDTILKMGESLKEDLESKLFFKPKFLPEKFLE